METFSCHRETISCSSERGIWGNLLESSEIVKRHGSAKLLAAHLPSVLVSPGTIDHNDLCHAHYPHHRLIILSIIMSVTSRATIDGGSLLGLLLSVQTSDNRVNLAVDRQHHCSHFLLALCNNYCRQKTALFQCHTPFLLLLIRIPVRLVIPSLD